MASNVQLREMAKQLSREFTDIAKNLDAWHTGKKAARVGGGMIGLLPLPPIAGVVSSVLTDAVGDGIQARRSTKETDALEKVEKLWGEFCRRVREELDQNPKILDSLREELRKEPAKPTIADNLHYIGTQISSVVTHYGASGRPDKLIRVIFWLKFVLKVCSIRDIVGGCQDLYNNTKSNASEIMTKMASVLDEFAETGKFGTE